MSSSASLIDIENLSVTLGQHRVIHNLKCQVLRGQITALIGLNGSGKTTFLRALLGEIPYSGRIQWRCGHNHNQGFPSHIGYVPQRLQFDLTLPLTVGELAALVLQKKPLFLGISKDVRKKTMEILERVWASDLIDRPLSGLSGGQLQRILLALAMEPKPELLLLDEPAQGIDFQSQNDFYDLIEKMNRDTGISMILVSHDLSVVSKFAHQVLCLKDGHILCSGTGQEVLSGTMIQQIYGPDQRVYEHRHG